MTAIEVEKTKTEDKVIQEVRKIKDDLAKEFDYDIKKMLDAARNKQKMSNRRVLSPPPSKQKL